MKILFIHYFCEKDGVTRVILNNIKGLKQCAPDLKFAFAGKHFGFPLPEGIEKRHIDWESKDILSQLQSVAQDADIVIIENPTVGIFPKATLAFKQFAEGNPDKRIIYRIHDLIDDRLHLLEAFQKICPSLNEIYPKSDNVAFLVLTSFDKERLAKKGLENVHVLPNSIIISDFETNKEKANRLRKRFEEKGLIHSDEKLLVYPVRIEKRKNIEEAILLTKILNDSGEKYRLVVTLPYLGEYMEQLKELAKKHNVPCSFGEASKDIGFEKEDYNIADLYMISDLVISTSVREGFGFTFIEPWLVGALVIGRRIPEINSDFEKNGIDLRFFYDNALLDCNENPEERIKKISSILSDPEKLKQISERLNLQDRIDKAKSVIDSNKKAIEKHYSHINVSKKLLDQIGKPLLQLNF